MFGKRPTGCEASKEFDPEFNACRDQYNSLLLKDDALRTAKLAEDAGVDVSIEVWDNMFHVFQSLPMSQSEASIARLGSFIRSRTVLSAVARPTTQTEIES